MLIIKFTQKYQFRKAKKKIKKKRNINALTKPTRKFISLRAALLISFSQFCLATSVSFLLVANFPTGVYLPAISSLHYRQTKKTEKPRRVKMGPNRFSGKIPLLNQQPGISAVGPEGEVEAMRKSFCH